MAQIKSNPIFTKDKMVQHDVDKKASQWSSYGASLWIQEVYNQQFSKSDPYFMQHQMDGESFIKYNTRTSNI